MFTQLTQCYSVVSKLECPDPEILKRYMRRFAKTIVKVLIAYADIVKGDFDEHLADERVVSVISKNSFIRSLIQKNWDFSYISICPVYSHVF